MQYRQKSFEDMEKSKPLIKEIDQDYGQVFGRGYGMIEAVDTVGAEIVLVTSGAMTSTARVAVQSLRDKGVQGRAFEDKGLPTLPLAGGAGGIKGRSQGGSSGPEYLHWERGDLLSGTEGCPLSSGDVAP